MTAERLVELAPLAALGALDGEDRSSFERELVTSPALAAELASFEELVGRLAREIAPVPPGPAVRRRVLEATGPRPAAGAAEPAAAARPARGRPVLAWLATAAAVVLGIGFLVARLQRDAARRDADVAAARAESLSAQVRDTLSQVDRLRKQVEEERAVRDLIAHRESRVATLAGLPAAPDARARVVWNPTSREAVLLADNLSPAPAGKAYEVWVIAGAQPVAAGTFQTDASGRALFRLPSLDDVARVKTFAVTVEPAEGTAAPTGPMVLAGGA
jgi:anti-sigma-K factor RskA